MNGSNRYWYTMLNNNIVHKLLYELVVFGAT